MSDADIKALAEHLMHTGVSNLSLRERRVLTRLAGRLKRHQIEAAIDRLTFGERLADQVASFGGSWRFIMLFLAGLLLWALLNSDFLRVPFDPYPYIFLNLILSMLAALQAPIIMMSQIRQAARDRLAAARDYEVNLNAETSIIALHDKFDMLRKEDLAQMLVRQQAQLDMLLMLLQREGHAA